MQSNHAFVTYFFTGPCHTGLARTRHKAQATSSTMREEKYKGRLFYFNAWHWQKDHSPNVALFFMAHFKVSSWLLSHHHMLKKGRAFLYPKYFGLFGWLKSVVQMFDAAAIKKELLLNNYDRVQWHLCFWLMKMPVQIFSTSSSRRAVSGRGVFFGGFVDSFLLKESLPEWILLVCISK